MGGLVGWHVGSCVARCLAIAPYFICRFILGGTGHKLLPACDFKLCPMSSGEACVTLCLLWCLSCHAVTRYVQYACLLCYVQYAYLTSCTGVQRVCVTLSHANTYACCASLPVQVFSEFVAQCGRGLTPNPDLACNRHIKFDALLTFADQLGADMGGCVGRGRGARGLGSTLDAAGEQAQGACVLACVPPAAWWC